MDYFNMSSDPLGQAAERASLCLFLRGDMKAASHAVLNLINEKKVRETWPMPRLTPSWDWSAWLTSVGTAINNNHDNGYIIADDWHYAEPQSPKSAYERNDGFLGELKSHGIIGANNPTDPARNILRSETGELTIDGAKDIMTLDTPKTAGGYAPAGSTVATEDGRLTIAMIESDATAWVSSLDGKPIAESKHLLLTHLTDLQNTDIKYAEGARQTLLDWGKTPHLVHAGKASIKLKNGGELKVWALATSGKRLNEVKSATADGVLTFTVDVAEDANNGARMLYEIAQK
jgi:hypothetical protein